MTTQQQIKNLLEVRLDFRERKNRYKAIWNLLLEKYHKDTWDKEMFILVGPEILSYVRGFCKVQEENIHLRGNDYPDKKRLAQEKMLELGYFPGLSQDLKKLSTLSNESQKEDDIRDSEEY